MNNTGGKITSIARTKKTGPNIFDNCKNLGFVSMLDSVSFVIRLLPSAIYWLVTNLLVAELISYLGRHVDPNVLRQAAMWGQPQPGFRVH